MDIQTNTQSSPVQSNVLAWTYSTHHLSHSPIQSTGPMDVLGLSMDIHAIYQSQSTGPVDVLGPSMDILSSIPSIPQSDPGPTDVFMDDQPNIPRIPQSDPYRMQSSGFVTFLMS